MTENQSKLERLKAQLDGIKNIESGLSLVASVGAMFYAHRKNKSGLKILGYGILGSMAIGTPMLLLNSQKKEALEAEIHILESKINSEQLNIM